MASSLKMYGEKYAWFAGTKVTLAQKYTNRKTDGNNNRNKENNNNLKSLIMYILSALISIIQCCIESILAQEYTAN